MEYRYIKANKEQENKKISNENQKLKEIVSNAENEINILKSNNLDLKNELNSILNRTYILGDTNRIFSSKQPIKYLKNLEENNNSYMLNTHFIPDNYKEYLNSEAIESECKIKKFYKFRLEKIKTIILFELSELKN